MMVYHLYEYNFVSKFDEIFRKKTYISGKVKKMTKSDVNNY